MFLVFEGIDGSGKSTQARLLEAHLRDQRGLEVLLVREPGGTALGERLRELLFEPGSESLAPETELFLFMAARSHLVRTRIRPALEGGAVVVSDRFLWSSAAYQGAAGAVGIDSVLGMGAVATADVRVTRTFVIDVDPGEALSRATGRNRMEQAGLEFQRAVRRGFLELAARDEEGAVVIDGRGSPQDVHERVLAALPDKATGP